MLIKWLTRKSLSAFFSWAKFWNLRSLVLLLLLSSQSQSSGWLAVCRWERIKNENCFYRALFSSFSNPLAVGWTMSSFVIVDTEHGKVKGVKKTSALSAAYDAFLGIRYGAPPTGEFRFKVGKSKLRGRWLSSHAEWTENEIFQL